MIMPVYWESIVCNIIANGVVCVINTKYYIRQKTTGLNCCLSLPSHIISAITVYTTPLYHIQYCHFIGWGVKSADSYRDNDVPPSQSHLSTLCKYIYNIAVYANVANIYIYIFRTLLDF